MMSQSYHIRFTKERKAKMNKKTSKFISMLVIMVMMLTLFTPVTAFAGTGEITILYTNDIHTYIDNEDGFDYAKLATLKKQYEDAMGEFERCRAKLERYITTMERQ
jgi:2',3'-cyclic-nucleotide 2'-phosphodiesterase (5'-nucleotidase family)